MEAVEGKSRTLLHIYDTGLSIPTTVIKGNAQGKRIVLSAGVHSREYIGIQALTELAEMLKPENINGTVTILHCCNYDGFIKRSADVFPQDGKNLNSIFPGNKNGSVTEKVAAFLEENIIENTDFLVDLHSGGFCEELTPHAYFHGTAKKAVCDMSEKIARLTSVSHIVRSSAQSGFYSYAGQKGVPAIILERGGLGLANQEEVKKDIQDVLNILRGLDFLNDGVPVENYPKELITNAFYENAPCDGCWHPFKKAGDFIEKNELIGEIRSIYGEVKEEIRAKVSGVILYQTASLGIESGTAMVAYGETDSSK